MEEYDDLVASASDYRAEIQALTKTETSQGVDIMQDEDTYKSTYQILLEIAQVWDQLSDVNQATLLEDLAGKRNTNVALSIITNLEDLTGAYDVATNAAGTAAEANDVYMDTIDAKVAQISATFQTFSADVLDSDLVKGLVDFGNDLLGIVDQLVDTFGLFPTLFASFMSYKFIAPKIKSLLGTDVKELFGFDLTDSLKDIFGESATSSAASGGEESASRQAVATADTLAAEQIVDAENKKKEAYLSTAEVAQNAANIEEQADTSAAAGSQAKAVAETEEAAAETVSTGTSAGETVATEAEAQADLEGAAASQAKAVAETEEAAAEASSAVSSGLDAGASAIQGAGETAGATLATGVSNGLLSTLTPLLIGAIAVAVAMGVANVIKSIRNNAIQDATQTGEDYETRKSDISSLREQVAEYQATIASSASSEAQVVSAKSGLLDIQKQLADQYGINVDLINSETNALSDLDDAISEDNINQAKRDYLSNDDTYDESIKKMQKVSKNEYSLGVVTESGVEALKEFQKEYSDIASVYTDLDSGKTYVDITGNIQQKYDALDDLYGKMVDIKDPGSTVDDSLEQYMDVLKDQLDTWSDSYEVAINLKINSDIDSAAVASNINAYTDKLDEAISGGNVEEISTAYDNLFGEDMQTAIGKLDDDALKTYFTNMLNDLKDGYSDAFAEINLNDELEDNIHGADFSGLMSKWLDTFKTEEGKIDLNLFDLFDLGDTSDLTEEQNAFAIMMRSWAEIFGYDDVSSMVAAYASLTGAEVETASAAEEAADSQTAAASKIQTAVETMTSAYELMNTAKTEMRDNGGLSNDTVQSIRDALESEDWNDTEQSYLETTGKQLSDFLDVDASGNIQLNTEAWNEFTNALNNNAIAANNDRIAILQAANAEMLSKEATGTENAEQYMANQKEIADLEYQNNLLTAEVANAKNQTENLTSVYDELSSQAETFATIREAMETGGASASTVLGWIEDIPELAPYFDELVNGSADMSDILDTIMVEDYGATIEDINARISELTGSETALTASEQTELSTLYALREAYAELSGELFAENKYAAVIKNGIGDNDDIVSEYQSYIDWWKEDYTGYQEDIAEAVSHGWDKQQTIFGNIDTNNRQVITWTEGLLQQYGNVLSQWTGNNLPDVGSISTVLGASNKFKIDGQEIPISFSPMLQTESGTPQILDKDTVNTYMGRVIDAAMEDGEWSEEEIIRIDAEGFDDILEDGTRIYGLISAVGDKAEDVSWLTHYTGEQGAIQEWVNDYEEMYSELQRFSDMHPEIDIDTSSLSAAEKSLDKYKNTLKASNWKKEIKNLWNSSVFEDARSDLESTAKEAGITSADIIELAESNEYLAYLMDDTGVSATYLAQIFEELGTTGSSAFEGITADAVALDNVLNQMDAPLASADKALQKYSESYGSWDYDDQYESYVDAWNNWHQDTYGQTYEERMNGDTADVAPEYGMDFWRSVELFMGEGHGADDISSVMETMNKIGNWFNGDDNGLSFLSDMYDNIGALKKESNGLIDVWKNADGSFGYNIDTLTDVDNNGWADAIEVIADKFGTTNEVVAACIQSLGMWGDYSEYTAEQLQDAFGDTSLGIEDTNGKIIASEQGVRAQLEALGLESTQIDQVLADLVENENIQLFDTSNYQEAYDYCSKIYGVLSEKNEQGTVSAYDMYDTLVAGGADDETARSYMKEMINNGYSLTGYSAYSHMTTDDIDNYAESFSNMGARAQEAQKYINKMTGSNNTFDLEATSAENAAARIDLLADARDRAITEGKSNLASAYQDQIDYLSNISTASSDSVSLVTEEMTRAGQKLATAISDYRTTVSSYGADSSQALAAQTDLETYINSLESVPEEITTSLNIDTEGKSAEEIKEETIAAIESGDYTIDVETDTSTLLQNISDAASEIKDILSGGDITFTISGGDESIAKIDEVSQAMDSLQENNDANLYVTLTGASSAEKYTSDIATDLLRITNGGFPWDVSISADAGDTESTLEGIIDQLTTINKGATANVTVTPSATTTPNQVTTVQNQSCTITVDADTSPAETKISTLSNDVNNMPAAEPITLDVVVDQSGVDLGVAEADEKIKTLNQTVNVTVNTSGDDTDGLAQDESGTVTMRADISDVESKLATMSAELDEATRTRHVTVLAIVSSALQSIGNVITKLSQVRNKTVTVSVNYAYDDSYYKPTPAVNGTAHSNGLAHVNGTALASGTWGKYMGGTALVGELGTELVV